MYLSEYTGRGVRIAVIDSGVHAAHPHISEPGGGVVGGLAIHDDGSTDEDFVDRLGHGTAVTAAIREKAPHAEIIAVKVFWRSLDTSVPTLVRAINEATSRSVNLINLSLGTDDGDHAEDLSAAVAEAGARGALVVAALETDGVKWLPGSLEGVVPVRLDWTCDRNVYRLVRIDGRTVIEASGYPRDIPGVPRERNLKGISFAVANATGFLARALEASSHGRLPAVFETLEMAAANQTPG